MKLVSQKIPASPNLPWHRPCQGLREEIKVVEPLIGCYFQMILHLMFMSLEVCVDLFCPKTVIL